LRQQKGAKVGKFVHASLLPALVALRDQVGATPRQRVVGEIVAGVERSRITSEKHFLQVLDEVHAISADAVEDTHIFTLAPASFSIAEVYEELLLRLGGKVSDGGQFYTPREVIRAMVRVVDPRIGQTVFDPACGTGGFLTEAYEYMRAGAGNSIPAEALGALRQRTFYGREKEGAVYPMAIANLVFRGIDEPHVWHGDALSKGTISDRLFADAPDTFDCVFLDPPFGGKEGKEAQAPYPYKTSAPQVLHLQEALRCLAPGGRGAMVIETGVLSRVDAEAFVLAKWQLIEECDVYCIVNLPGGVFTSVGPSVKSHLVFFERGRPTESIWYYDLSDVKTGKKAGLTLEHFDEFFRLLPERAETEQSWSEDIGGRVRSAQQEARPHREAAAEFTTQSKTLEEDWRAAHETMSSPEDLHAMEQQWKALLREAHAAESRAALIEYAAYDLTAVHPSRRGIGEIAESRSAEELLAQIEKQGRAVDEALARLQALLAEP
jgi:type I restriction enzyme M protein